MPKKIEEALKRSALAHGYKPKTERYNRYVYGTLAKIKECKDGGTDHDRKPNAG